MDKDILREIYGRFGFNSYFLEEIQFCHKCFMAGNNHPILDSFDRNAQYMMIYEMSCSMQTSDRIVPGPVRQILDDAFTVSGFSQDSFYIMNIEKCNLDNSSFKKDTCIRYCLSYKIEILQPTYIISLGKKDLRLNTKLGFHMAKPSWVGDFITWECLCIPCFT